MTASAPATNKLRRRRHAIMKNETGILVGGFQGWWGVRSFLCSSLKRSSESSGFMRRTNANAVLELSGICLLSCACLALAWAHEAEYFGFFFAIAAAISGEAAIRRSLL